MSKNNNTTPSSNKTRGSNKNPAGYMPKDKITRFKLSGNFVEGRTKYVSRNTKVVAKSVRLLSTYRMHAHKVAETKLPNQLVQSVHYFLTPMSRADSDNSKDRKGLDVAVEADNSASETDTNS